MKKVLFLLLLLVICAPSRAMDKMCADTTFVGGGNGFHSPNPHSVPVSYSIDNDLGLVSMSTTETEQVRVQITGCISGLVDDELFNGSTSIVLYYHDFYEIRFIIQSGDTYIDYFYL